MAVAWTQHRFSGGVLALNVSNTVVNPHRPALRLDRFADPAEIGRFAEAASLYCADELGGRPLAAPEPPKVHERVLALREAIDRLFRTRATAGLLDTGHLAALLAASAGALAGRREGLSPGRPFGDPATPLAFEAGVALSALSLLDEGKLTRIKICRHCAWLFLDRSRNASRLWCDMAVCGNRQKARRHYRRRVAAREGIDG